ncbi:Hint domain-containing protein [Pseudotabrizicola sp. L79]|uniref:Hint domain-containing protein n=1 Tax=Pseudotabrizicola sp. L79 TaxID=3118402 RepID=UPI002F91DEDE
MPVFALYNLNDPTTVAVDSASADGAQNGVYYNGAISDGNQAVLDGLDDIVKFINDPVFQLDRGTLEIQFTLDPATNLDVTRTVLSRDSAGATQGGYRIEVLPDGVIQITHETATGSEVFSTDVGFYTPGDEINVSYSWDFGGEGGTVQIENLTTGTNYTDDVPNTLTMDMGDNSRNWIIGADQANSPAGTLANIDSHFQGAVEYFSISDTVDNTPTDPVGDGLVEGTSGDDLIDLAYLGDPEGDRIDNSDALLPGEAPQDDIVLAGAGNDTVVALAGNDDITGAAGDDLVYGGDGNDVATGDGGRDILHGDAGDDTLAGGADQDTLFGGAGNDLLNGGLGDDVLDGGTGNDTLEGLDGNDVINAGAGNDSVNAGLGNDYIDTRAPGDDSSPDRSFPGLYTADTNPTDDRDTVDAGAGADTIFTGDDNDVIVSGGGNDFVHAGDDDDSVQGNDGDDTIQAGEGNDTVTGDLGNDVIYGGTREDATDPTHLTDDIDPDADNNRDLLAGGMGNDTVYGGDDADTLSGGLGDDLLDGGIDDDIIMGDAGNDVIIGGHGADSLYGGGDRDVFVGGSAGDVIEGGETGDDFDTLDLRGAGPLRVTFDPLNNENGTVEFLDDLGAVTGTMTFVEIENVLVPEGEGPTANPDTLVTDEDTDPTIDVLANDTDPTDQPLTVTSATAENGEVTINSDGTITYSPYMHFNGPDTITYTVTDPDGNTSTTTVAVTVNPVNDAPEAVDDAAATPLDTPVVIDVLGNDMDIDGDTLSIVGTPTSPNGTVAVNPDGSLTFTPTAGFVGSAVITYTMTDGTVTDDAQVVVTVGGLGRDGVVSGTAGDDLIDESYVDPTDGDQVDASDAILPGSSPDADSIVAGDGNDTILAGRDDDTIFAGSGDDEVFGGDGSESVHGGAGDDTILTGDGQDIVFGEDGDDYIDTRGPNPLPDIDYPGLYGADTDPLNDLDTVYGGDGNDTIFTGDDADRVFGRNGNDYIDGGFDNDSLYGNSGFDTIIGSEGNDYIDGGRGDDLIYGGLDLTFPDVINIPNDGGDLRPANNADSIVGGFGNDTIYGMDDDDTISGDQGDDLIFGGVDNDQLLGADGDDTLHGDDGNDMLEGNTGDDLMFGGAGNDSLDGGLGDDTLDGGTGDDVLAGADGDDLLTGGLGNDTLDGGVNNDTLLGGDGADSLVGDFGRDLLDLGTDGTPDGVADVAYGGFDEDTITGVGIGDTVYGGGNGEGSDQDVLDLRNSGPHRIVDRVADSDGNGFDGTVQYLDGAGNVIGTATFTNIENIICFTPGTMIATPRGEVPVENLRVGDKVITRDNGIQEIRWAGARQMGWHDFAANPHLRPVMVKAGSLGNGLPERDMMLSPNHRVLVANDRTALYFDEHEVLVAAKHLIGGKGVHQVESVGTTYVHFMFDQHEVVLSNGAWTESFQPGDYSLKGLGNAQRTEIFELFPELKTEAGLGSYQAARKTLKKHEARLLLR